MSASHATLPSLLMTRMELPAVQEVGDWLAANLPETHETTIVHGDFRLGNAMFAPEAPARLTAIRVGAGDRVRVALARYDHTRGRIVSRL